MDLKTLIEANWKGIVAKFKLKDNGVQRCLANYARLKDDQHDELLDELNELIKLATALKKAKEVVAAPVASKYLDEMLKAAQSEKSEVVKAKAAVEKAGIAEAKAEAAQAKLDALKAKAEAEEAQREVEEDEDDGEEEESGDYVEKLKKMLGALKSAKQPYHFLVCDAKPNCAVMISKQLIGAKQRTELTSVTGGSKLFLKPGTCRRDGNTLIFDLPNPPSGLAMKIMKSLKNFLGLKFKVMVGNESAEDEESGAVAAGLAGETAAQAEAAPLPPLPPKLAKAPATWRATQKSVQSSVQQLQAAVRKALAGESPAVVAEVEDSVTALDGVADMLGNELPSLLQRAAAAKDLAGRNTQLKNARTLVSGYLRYANGPGAGLLAHIDANPFGVKTELKKKLTAGLTEMAEAISTSA